MPVFSSILNNTTSLPILLVAIFLLGGVVIGTLLWSIRSYLATFQENMQNLIEKSKEEARKDIESLQKSVEKSHDKFELKIEDLTKKISFFEGTMKKV